MIRGRIAWNGWIITGWTDCLQRAGGRLGRTDWIMIRGRIAWNGWISQADWIITEMRRYFTWNRMILVCTKSRRYIRYALVIWCFLYTFGDQCAYLGKTARSFNIGPDEHFGPKMSSSGPILNSSGPILNSSGPIIIHRAPILTHRVRYY